MLHSIIGNMHPKSQPEAQTRQISQSNLVVLSTTIQHVYCRNPSWCKPQAAYCLCQLTHLAILVLKQLKSLIPAAYYCEITVSSQVETHSTCNSIMILSFLFLIWTRNASMLKSMWRSEAIVCFVQHCSRCWVCETFEAHAAFRDKISQHGTKNLI